MRRVIDLKRNTPLRFRARRLRLIVRTDAVSRNWATINMKRTIKRNVYGNWHGYEGGRKGRGLFARTHGSRSRTHANGWQDACG